MKITILFPTAHEATPYIEKYGMEGVSICGIGLAECAAGTVRAITTQRPDFIILAGIAGAYEGSELKKGDTVTVNREHSADLGAMRGDKFVPLARNIDITDNHYSNDTILPDIFPSVVSNSVNTAGSIFKSQQSASSDIENMEGAAFFAVCQAFGIKYAELRSISNIVGEHPSVWDIPQAASNLADSVDLFIRKLRLL